VKSGFELYLALLVALLLACCQDASHAGTTDRPWSCAGCHVPEFKSTARPPHENVRPEACGVCHAQSSWHGVRIDHPWWALTGAHARAAADQSLAGKEQRVKCFWCHRGEPAVFGGTPTTCIGCHAEDRVGVQFPEHDTFSTSCETCHSSEAWKPARRPLVAPRLPAAAPSAAIVKSAKSTKAPVAAPRSSPSHVTSTPKPPATPPATPPPDIVSHASRRH
jgi:hypothetical protein